MPAEFWHVVIKVYCFSGLKSLTVSREFEVAVSTVNSFPPSKLYLTIYLTVPASVQPLNVNTTDWAVLLSIDTLGLDGTVWRS